MVSNDDIIIQVQGTELQKIKQELFPGTAQYTQEWAIPSNETWNLKRVIGERGTGTNLIFIYIKDTDDNVMVLAESNTSFEEYEPKQSFIMPAGWKICVRFEADVDTIRTASLIIDKLDSY